MSPYIKTFGNCWTRLSPGLFHLGDSTAPEFLFNIAFRCASKILWKFVICLNYTYYSVLMDSELILFSDFATIY